MSNGVLGERQIREGGVGLASRENKDLPRKGTAGKLPMVCALRSLLRKDPREEASLVEIPHLPVPLRYYASGMGFVQ